MDRTSQQDFGSAESHSHRMTAHDRMPEHAQTNTDTNTNTNSTPTLQDLYESIRDTPECQVAQMFLEGFKVDDDPDVEEMYQVYLKNGNKPMKKLVFKEKGGYPNDGEIDPNANWGIYQRMHGNPENHRRYPLDHVPFPARDMEVKWVDPGHPDYPADPEHAISFRRQAAAAAESRTAPLPQEIRNHLSQVHEAAASFHDADDRTFFPAGAQQLTARQLAAPQPIAPRAIHLPRTRGSRGARKDHKNLQEGAYQAAIAKRDAQASYNPYATPGSSNHGQKHAEPSPSVLSFLHSHQLSATSTPTLSRSMQNSATQIARDIGAQFAANSKLEESRSPAHRKTRSTQLYPDSPSFNLQQPRKASNDSQNSPVIPNLGKGNHSKELLEILRQNELGAKASAQQQPKVGNVHRPSSQPDLMDTIRGNLASSNHQHELRLQKAAIDRERYQERQRLIAGANRADSNTSFRPDVSRTQTHSQVFSGNPGGFNSTGPLSSAYLQSLHQTPSFYQQNQASTTKPRGHFRTASARSSDVKPFMTTMTQGTPQPHMSFIPGQPNTHFRPGSARPSDASTTTMSTQGMTQAQMSFGAGQSNAGQSNVGHANAGQANDGQANASFNPSNFNASNIDFSFKPF